MKRGPWGLAALGAVAAGAAIALYAGFGDETQPGPSVDAEGTPPPAEPMAAHPSAPSADDVVEAPQAGTDAPETHPAPPEGDGIDDLRARLAEADAVGGAYDPIPFPADVRPQHTQEGVQAWVDSVRAECPSAADARFEVDCAEFPCVVLAVWAGEVDHKDVLCLPHDLALGVVVNVETYLDDTLYNAAIRPVGPPRPTPSFDMEMFEARFNLRRSAAVDYALELATEMHAPTSP